MRHPLRANDCKLQDIHGVVAVGGGARIPLLRKWLKEHSETVEQQMSNKEWDEIKYEVAVANRVLAEVGLATGFEPR